MDFAKLNNNQMVILIICAIVLIWVFMPYLQQLWNGRIYNKEMFNHPNEVSGKTTETEVPFVDPQAGTLISGPGFEKGVSGDVYQPANAKVPSNYYFLDDGADGEMSIQHNLCSRSCCAEQWPTPFKQKYDPYVCGNKDKFVPSRIMCNNSFQDSGCLCLTKKQAKFIYNRGTNGREWF